MTRLGYEYDVIKAVKDEITTETKPENIVKELSFNKMLEVCEGLDKKDDYIILAADTVVAYEGKVLGKPKDRTDAKVMLGLISGHTHQVYTGVTIRRTGDERTVCFFEKTDVTVKPMTEAEISEYVATGECDDKAGAYAIQGIFSKYIDGYSGDYSNVVGLPASRVKTELDSLMEDMR